MATTITSASLAYWLHLYRRLFPGPIGQNTDPVTIGLTRAVLEAAIQKHAPLERCGKLAPHKDIPIDAVLGGMLMSDDFTMERQLLAAAPNQLVFTDFSMDNLAEFYALERLAYEVWRTSATLRGIGKGATLQVIDGPIWFGEVRSDELDALIHVYDKRSRLSSVTATGAVFPATSDSPDSRGLVFLPTYNLEAITCRQLHDTIRQWLRISRLPHDMAFNFLWHTFNLRGFRQVHAPLARAFESLHKVSLDAVLTIVASLSARVAICWGRRDLGVLYQWFQRAYEGPSKRSLIMTDLLEFLPLALELLGLPPDTKSTLDIDQAIDFWTLHDEKRDQIDLLYSGPHHLFLPIGDDRFFVDYAWIHRRLFDLFHRVSIEDQNFKGDALEALVRKGPSALPHSPPCRARSGESRQFDHAVALGTHLVIVECKAMGRSIGFDRGDPKAVEVRRERLVEKSLTDIDEKAQWLARNPKGSNYDATAYADIVPVVVSPFVEFIHSSSPRYWVSSDVPRIMTPDELAEFLQDEETVAASWNHVRLGRSD